MKGYAKIVSPRRDVIKTPPTRIPPLTPPFCDVERNAYVRTAVCVSVGQYYNSVANYPRPQDHQRELNLYHVITYMHRHALEPYCDT